MGRPPPDDRDSAVLVVDEPTANAALYGHADMALLLALDHGMLVIGVADSGAEVVRDRYRGGIDPPACARWWPWRAGGVQSGRDSPCRS
ncbi:hypothetical protein [Kitasatospora aburaviensis]|uniref:Uncharacterized protein n=1 Tax=Kitasatospora aburaviensis TaxID=67265 RepID=A0ABW1EZ76_9ACTN